MLRRYVLRSTREGILLVMSATTTTPALEKYLLLRIMNVAGFIVFRASGTLMMSTKCTRQELLVFGWTRQHKHKYQLVPNGVIKLFQLYSKNIVLWDIEPLQFHNRIIDNRWDNASHILDGPTFNVEGVQFQLTMEYRESLEIARFYLKLEKSSLLKNTLSVDVSIDAKNNLYFQQESPALHFDVAEHKYKHKIFESYNFTLDDCSPISYQFTVHIVDIKYHTMKIKSQWKWKLSLKDLRTFNQATDGINYENNNIKLLLYPNNGDGLAGLGAEITWLPVGIMELKIQYNLRIKAKGSGIDDLDIDVDGKENLNNFGRWLYQWPNSLQFPHAVYWEFCVKMEMEIVEVHSDSIHDLYSNVEESLWREYGFINESSVP